MLSGSITLKSYSVYVTVADHRQGVRYDGDLMGVLSDVLEFTAHQSPALHES